MLSQLLRRGLEAQQQKMQLNNMTNVEVVEASQLRDHTTKALARPAQVSEYLTTQKDRILK